MAGELFSVLVAGAFVAFSGYAIDAALRQQLRADHSRSADWRYSKGFRTGCVAFSLAMLAVSVVVLPNAVIEPSLAQWLRIGWPLVTLPWSAWLLIVAFSFRLGADAEGIYSHALFGSRQLAWRDLERVDWHYGYRITLRGGRDRLTANAFIQGLPALLEEIAHHAPHADQRQIRSVLGPHLK